MKLRLLLKRILAKYAKWAIAKHGIETIVILGVDGTETIKEVSFAVLENKFSVRRIINKPWWDLSIPLSILGYKDKQRSFLFWIILLIKIPIYLLLGPKNPQSIIINLNYKHEDTMKFWVNILKPNILILSNQNKKNEYINLFIDETIHKNGSILLHTSHKSSLAKSYLKYSKLYFVGQEKGTFLQSIPQKDKIIFKFKKSESQLNIRHATFIPIESYELATLLAIVKKIPLEEAVTSEIKFDLPSILSKIRLNLYKDIE